MPGPASHTLAIHDLLTRFFQAFDEKDWGAMRACLAEEVYTDYSSFRAVPAETMSGDRYVEERRRALSRLEMQHDFMNLRVELDPGSATATARCNYAIHRFHPTFDGTNDRYFHSWGHYRFGLAWSEGGWCISRITQRLLRSQGNRGIHGGVMPPTPEPPGC